MSFADFQDKLKRSIKVINLPKNYSQDEILSNFRNAGTIDDLKAGPTELIITYASQEEKDLSRMYEGCNVGDYTIVLEDPTSFEFASEEEDKNLSLKRDESEFEIINEKSHESPREEKDSKPEPVSSYESYKAKETVIVDEPVVKKTVTETRTERVEETRTERVSERVQERGQEESRSAATKEPLRVEENAKELLRELQNTNLPARAALPSNDLWKNVSNRNYLLIFTIIWGLQLFLRSILCGIEG